MIDDRERESVSVNVDVNVCHHNNNNNKNKNQEKHTNNFHSQCLFHSEVLINLVQRASLRITVVVLCVFLCLSLSLFVGGVIEEEKVIKNSRESILFSYFLFSLCIFLCSECVFS